MHSGRNNISKSPQSGSRFLREIQNQNNYFSPNVSGYQHHNSNSKSKLRLKSSTQRIGLNLSRNSSYNKRQEHSQSRGHADKYYLNKENDPRLNKGFYSPDIRSKKSSNAYLQNFQKLMGGRSGSRNNISHNQNQNSGRSSPQSNRLKHLDSFRRSKMEKNLELYTKKISNNLKKSPKQSLIDKMNSSYGYQNINGSLNLNSSNSSYHRNKLSPSASPGRLDIKYPSSNHKKLEYAQQISQIAQMRQLGKFELKNPQSPSIKNKYLQLRMNSKSSLNNSDHRRKFKSPKRKSPSSKNIMKKSSSSSKKLSKRSQKSGKRSVLRKGSLGMIERFQNNRFASDNSSAGENLDELRKKYSQANNSSRNRSYNHTSNYPLMGKILKDEQQSSGRGNVSKFTLDSEATRNLMSQIQRKHRNDSSPKLSKQKLKLRNVLQQNVSTNNSPSPQRNKSQKLKNVLNSKWSKSRDRTLNSPSIDKSSYLRRSPRLSNNSKSRNIERNKSSRESPVRIGGSGAELLGAIYRKQSVKKMQNIQRKQSSGSGIGLNLVRHTQSKGQSSRNSNFETDQSPPSPQHQAQDFNTGLKLHTRKRSNWNSKKRLNSSNYSRTSANDSQVSQNQSSSNGQQMNFNNLTSLRKANPNKCVEKIVDINNYKKDMAESGILQNQTQQSFKNVLSDQKNPENNLMEANTHHFNQHYHHHQYKQPSQTTDNSLARKLSPFNLSQRRGSSHTQATVHDRVANPSQSQTTSQRNSSNQVTTTGPTIKISSKRNLLNNSQQSNNSTSRTSRSKTMSQNVSDITMKTANSKEKYNKFYKIMPEEYKKFKDLTFIERCGYQLSCINKGFKVGKDVYDMIRIYADHAQEPDFNKIETIFQDQQASNLFSRIMKLERWAITLVFYFQVEPFNKPDAENMLTVMKNLVEEIWKNHNNIVNWIKILNKEYKLKWILNDLNRIYWDVNLDMTRLVIHIKSCVRVITGLLQQMNSYLSKDHQNFQEIFFENLDNWSVVKCFEKGFECFYQSLADKGVISVNKSTKQSSSGQKQNTGAGEENMAMGAGQQQLSMQNYQDQAKNQTQGQNLKLQDIGSYNSQMNMQHAKVSTPKKKYNTSVIEEVDEELQKTERKSIGEKSQESNESKKNRKKLENKVTPNLNNTKHPKSARRTPSLDKKTLERKSKEPTTNEKLRINKHLEEEEEDAMEIMKAARKIENVPFFLFQPDTNQMNQHRALLPSIKEDRRYTLVLDLDETLVHFQEQENGKNQFLIRPYAQFFLKEMSKWYELVIFTAGLKDYADYILDRLDSQNWITHRLYRRHCDPQGNVYQKDLSKLGRDLSKTLIVDNSAENFQLQPDNGIYIKSWYDAPEDKALPQLAPLLIDIVRKNYADVRVAMRKLGEKMMEQYNANPQKPIFELSLEPQGHENAEN